MTNRMLDDSRKDDDSTGGDRAQQGNSSPGDSAALQENFSEDDVMAAFEQAIALSEQEHYCLRLYIAGATLRSAEAIRNLKHICEEHLQGRYTLEIIDVYKSPQEAVPENIVAIPTLIKALPPPLQRLIGDLSNTEKVLVGLNLLSKNDVS